MAGIQYIANAFELLQHSITDIKSYHFDELSIINDDRDKEYKCLLLKLPQASFKDNYKLPMEQYDIVFYVFDTFMQDDIRNRATVWDELKSLAEACLDTLLVNPNLMRLSSDQKVTYNYGHDEHNDNLIGVKVSFSIQIPRC